MQSPAISVVVPVFNEVENVSELYQRTCRVIEGLGLEYEFVFVDDGSTDGTGSVLRKLAEENCRVKVIFLSRNFNQHSSIAAGFLFSTGSRVVLMDADLQDVPEELPKLLRKVDEGFDLVYALRENRADSFYRKILARAFFLLFRLYSGFTLPENISTYRVASRRFVDAFNRLKDHNRFTAGLMAWLGFTVATVPVRHETRKRGKSKYTLMKLARLSIDAIISFSAAPLKLSSLCGIALSGLSLLAGAWEIYWKLAFGIALHGYASIIVAILFLAGVQLFFLGIIGEYLSRIYLEVLARPLFVVRETLNLEETLNREIAPGCPRRIPA